MYTDLRYLSKTIDQLLILSVTQNSWCIDQSIYTTITSRPTNENILFIISVKLVLYGTMALLLICRSKVVGSKSASPPVVIVYVWASKLFYSIDHKRINGPRGEALIKSKDILIIARYGQVIRFCTAGIQNHTQS
jgi:hypothetical protein